MLIRIIYSLFIGVLLAVAVGVGIAAFYEAPKAPAPPVSVPEAPSIASPSAQSQTIKQQNDMYMAYQQKSQAYSTRVAVIALVMAIIYLVVSLTVLLHLPIFADGVLYGGVFTLLYGIARILMGQNTRYEFIFIVCSLIVAVLVGYIKFIKPNSAPHTQ